MNDELHKFDVKVVNEMDSKVFEQQETMHQAGVYGFQRTSQPDDVRSQMYLLKFIQRLSKTNMPY
jgi:hypothetical protein